MNSPSPLKRDNQISTIKSERYTEDGQLISKTDRVNNY
jgi:hypothetical protein